MIVGGDSAESEMQLVWRNTLKVASFYALLLLLNVIGVVLQYMMGIGSGGHLPELLLFPLMVSLIFLLLLSIPIRYFFKARRFWVLSLLYLVVWGVLIGADYAEEGRFLTTEVDHLDLSYEVNQRLNAYVLPVQYGVTGDVKGEVEHTFMLLTTVGVFVYLLLIGYVNEFVVYPVVKARYLPSKYKRQMRDKQRRHHKKSDDSDKRKKRRKRIHPTSRRDNTDSSDTSDN